ncbi:hypothetical protein Z046_31490 [Pseudomonas aeruginosa VRFPA09]|nr:hypothetical protein Z046_31490 [Pseudomonas aeruginosa VRFPA09]
MAELTSRATLSRSGTVAVNATEVECSIRITSLLKYGSARRSAEGRTMRR